MAKNRSQHAPRDRKRPFRMPDPPCVPKPPRMPPPPRPADPGCDTGPSPLEVLKRLGLGKK